MEKAQQHHREQTALERFPSQGIHQSEHPGDYKDYHPDVFSHRHKLAVLLKATGLTNKEIAEALNYTEARVSVILNDPRAPAVMHEHAKEVADSLEDVRQRLKFYASEALTEVVEEMRYCDDPRVRQRAAFGILDRAGYSKIEKRFVATTQVDKEGTKEIADALRESAEADDAIEVEYSIPEEADDG